MSTLTANSLSLRSAFICACLVVALPLIARAADELPATSPEGLELQKDTKARVVYLKPGASLAPYKRVAILDCYVEFTKDWQKDFNSTASGLNGRVSAKDMDRIKANLSAEFKKIFKDELQAKGGYEVVDTAAPDVLVLRPALINLVVTAPDLMTAGMSRVVVDSAGQMTLYLELFDSVSNTLLARVLDPKADRGSMAQVSSSVSNKSAADRILRQWAAALRKHLDAAEGRTSAP